MSNGIELISKLGIGTVQFGLDYGITNRVGRTSLSEVTEILNIATLNGVELLDTAQSYGLSETVLGKTHQNRFKIVTKLDLSNLNSSTLADVLNPSLNKLGLKSIYGVLFHDTQEALKHPGILAVVKELKTQGLIKKIGFSVYETSEIVEIQRKFGQPDIVQIPFSHVDRRFEDIAIKLKSSGVEIHSRSTFLQGLLLRNWQENLHSFFESISSYIEDFCSVTDSENERAQILLKYSLSRSFIDYVIIGVNTKEQLLENLQLTSADLTKLPVIPQKFESAILRPFLWPK